jgi:hypothetical protein
MKKINKKSEFTCIICNKCYSSQSSLCNHNKKFHTNNNTNCTSKCTSKCTSNINKCKYCFKNYSSRQNKWNHEQKCKNKENKIDEINELKQTINELKAQVSMILQRGLF